jgi:hypothetical protein
MSNIRLLDHLEIMDKTVLISLFVSDSIIYHGSIERFNKSIYGGLDKVTLKAVTLDYELREKIVIPYIKFHLDCKLDFVTGA